MTVLRETLQTLPDVTFADVFESADAYLVVLDVPGMSADALTVRGGAASVEITGDRATSTPAGYEPVRTGRDVDLDVTLPLPPDARGEAVRTALDRGVLELTIPKDDEAARGLTDGPDTEATG